MTRLREHYKEVVRDALQKEFSYENTMEIPRLEKIVINMGVGDATQDRKKLEGAAADLAAITGQKPVFTKAKKSVAAFKLREGMNIGCKVTLRRDRLFGFPGPLVRHRAAARVVASAGAKKFFGGGGCFLGGGGKGVFFFGGGGGQGGLCRGGGYPLLYRGKVGGGGPPLLGAFFSLWKTNGGWPPPRHGQEKRCRA